MYLEYDVHGYAINAGCSWTKNRRHDFLRQRIIDDTNELMALIDDEKEKVG